MKTFRYKQRITPYVLLLPSLLVLCFVLLYPLIYSLFLSFHRMIITRPDLGTPFVGIGNYIKLFSNDSFYRSLRTTVSFTFFATLLELVIGFSIALLIDKATFGQNITRSLVLIPLMIAQVAVGIMWQVMLHDQYGVLNYLLRRLGLPSEAWFASDLVMPTMVLTDIWQLTPFVIIVLTAGLQGLPVELYEAASIDGASSFQKFRFITIPLLRQILLVVIIIRTMDAFRIFDRIWIITQGGPGDSSTVLSILAYKQLVQYYDIGLGSTISWVILLLIVVMSLTFVRIMRSKQ